MSRRLFLTIHISLLAFFASFSVSAQPETTNKTVNPQVIMETSEGTMLIELYPEQAPKTVENFLKYVNDNFYDGTIFHRVIGNFMIQGGGFNANLEQKATRTPIVNEANNILRNRIGTIAMARTNDPHSATSQFFINTAQNNALDFREKTPRAWGYAVFGRVVKGMKTVNKIRMQRTTTQKGMADVPVKTVTILKVRQVK